jgi:hypothetical protein
MPRLSTLTTPAAGVAENAGWSPARALEFIQLAGTEGARDPFFSPDGRWIAYVAGGKLRRVPADGGIPQTICDAGEGRGGSWGPDDTIILSPGVTSGLFAVPAAGGTPEPPATPDRSCPVCPDVPRYGRAGPPGRGIRSVTA